MKSKNKIPVSQPYLTKQGRKYLLDAYDTNWISSGGSYIQKFEEAWAAKNNYKYGVACSSGTTSLVIAQRALGLGSSKVEKSDFRVPDEVIIPNFTMIACPWSTDMVGAKPHFVDCGDDLNINVDLIEEAIRPNTKAIMPVHIYGRRCNMERIMEIAKDYNLLVIEDMSEAHGIQPVGDIACYSLFGNKIITAGEGGICLTNDKRLYEQMIHLRSMAFDKNHTFLHKKTGYNFRMTNMQAAVALSQVEAFDEILKKRQQIELWYNEGLKDVPLINTQDRHVLWMYDIRVQTSIRDELMKFLSDKGIETRMFFKPMVEQPMYRHTASLQRSKAFVVSREGLYLPTFTDITKKQVDFVCDAVKEFFTKYQIK